MTLPCAVIVVSYRTGPVLHAALDALAGAGAGEILIVDNGNDAEAEAALDAHAARLGARVLRGQGNVGFGAGCNLAARQTRRDALVFVNPDLAVAPDALRVLVETLHVQPGLALVGGRPLGPYGREQRGARRDIYTPGNVLLYALGLANPHHETETLPPGPIEVGAVSGALFAMRRADFLALGGFDEGYFLHVEDVDLCRRVHEAGGVVLFEPRASGRHQGGSSDAPKAFVEREKAKSFARYFQKFARTNVERLTGRIAAFGIACALRARLILKR